MNLTLGSLHLIPGVTDRSVLWKMWVIPCAVISTYWSSEGVKIQPMVQEMKTKIKNRIYCPMYSMWVVGTNSKKFENSIFQYWCFFPVDIMTSLCCFTNWKSEWFPSKHRCTTNYFPLDDVLQCGVPEHNERDILMMFHLFICRKWRGTAMDWNSWQNKDPTLW